MVIDTISKEEVDALAKSLLSYLSHYNQEQQVGAGRRPWQIGNASCLERLDWDS